MKTNIFSLIVITAAIQMIQGCTASREIRQRALDLDTQILAFRDEQKARIETLNQDYREASTQYFNELRALGNEQLSLDRDHDSEALADDLVINLQATSAPGKFADRLMATVQAERQKLRAVDQQIQDARDKYASNYQQLILSVNKLDDLHNQLSILSAPDTSASVLSIAIKDAQSAYNGVKAAQKDFAAKQQAAKP